MAQILFVTPNYPPEKGAKQVRISETAKRLVQCGHQVTVLTTVPNYPTGIVPPEYHNGKSREEIRDGVHIVRVWSYIRPNKGFFQRILAQLSFGCLSPLLGARKVGRPDVIIVESPPLFDAFAARMLSWLKKCPFIFTVSDIWPESAIQLGMLRNHIFIWLSERLERSAYQRADLVWVVTQGICDTLVARGVPKEKVFLLTNGVDTSEFRPYPQEQARVELGWDQRFVVLYAGTHGLSQGLATVLDAAQLLQDRAEIHIVFVGDGAEKENLVAKAREMSLTNITFFDPMPHARMPLLLSACDVCLVPLRRLPLFQGALPSKMYEVMACARPIILGVEGEARRLVEKEAGSAIAVEPENARALASAILHLYKHPEEIERLGQQGRAFVEAHFDRDQLVAELDTRILELLQKREAIAFSVTPT
jgi:colanic acid biosynthesis glycosyl transferase WcaI